jgi:hypothetical protein
MQSIAESVAQSVLSIIAAAKDLDNQLSAKSQKPRANCYLPIAIC